MASTDGRQSPNMLTCQPGTALSKHPVVLACAAVLASTLTAQDWWRESIPSARIDGGMAYDQLNMRAIMFGGACGPCRFDDTWEWTGTRWVGRNVSPQANRPPARGQCGLTYEPTNNRTLLFGGRALQGQNIVYVNDTWAWDGSTWSQMQPTTSSSWLEG